MMVPQRQSSLADQVTRPVFNHPASWSLRDKSPPPSPPRGGTRIASPVDEPPPMDPLPVSLAPYSPVRDDFALHARPMPRFDQYPDPPPSPLDGTILGQVASVSTACRHLSVSSVCANAVDIEDLCDPCVTPCKAMACNDCSLRYGRCNCTPELSGAGPSLHDF